MKRFWGHIWAASITASLGGIILPACAHDDSSIYILAVVAPPKADATGGCAYPAPATNISRLFSGLLDVGLASEYAPAVMIGNQLNARSDQVNIRTETNRYQVRGAIVRVTDSVGNELANFTSLSNAVVDPQSGTAPGLGMAVLKLIDSGTTARLRTGDLALTDRRLSKTLVTTFKVFGQTLGGTYLESGDFQFLVEACNGCSVSFPPESDDTNAALVQPNCLAPLTSTASASSTVLVPCTRGQDQPIDCRLCQDKIACDPKALLPP